MMLSVCPLITSWSQGLYLQILICGGDWWLREPIVPERRICYLHFPTEEGAPRHSEPSGNNRGLIRRHEAEKGALKPGLYWGIHGKARQGRANSLGQASVNNSSGLWARDMVSNSWPWDNLGQGKYWLDVWELEKLDPSGLHIKGMLLAEPSGISKNWLALGGPSLLGQQDF